MRRMVCCVALLLAGLIAVPAAASPIGPVYPPPGGVTCCSGVGTSGTGTGIMRTYTNLDPLGGGYSDLWFGVFDIFVPLSSVSGSGTMQAITLPPTIVGNTATWDGSLQWQIGTPSGSIFRPVRYQMSAFDIGGAPVGLIPASSVPGLAGSEGAVLNVTGSLLTSGFKINQVFQVFNGATWVGVDDFFNSMSTTCSFCVQKSVNGGFWYEPTATVPEPASLLLTGSGLLVAARRVSKRRRSR
jgi:hypothetical protein